MHFTSESLVEHVVWERCLWCLSLYLNREVTCCLTVGLDPFKKGINNHLTTMHWPIMNILVHIIRFCARESVAHAQKEYKVKPRFN